MKIAVQKLLGVGTIPQDRTAAKRWLDAQSVPFAICNLDRRRPVSVLLSDLPEQERLAVIERELVTAGLEMGQYDEAAHKEYLAAPASIRSKAEKRAAFVRELWIMGPDIGWSERLKILRKKFGDHTPSKMTLKRYLTAVKGVDPVNFAPALMPGYQTSGAPRSEVDDNAWSLFMTIIRDAAPTFPLKQAWRDVRDIAASKGWAWPSYTTAYRRWAALPVAQQRAARYGKAETAKTLTQPVLRDKTTLRVLECVSLDGRTQDYWTDMGDGKPVRLTMIALIDVASNFILGYELVPSENAVATARLIRRVCAKFGIFDMLYTDNGSAFAGHLVAGGVDHKFRNAATNKGMRPLGICHHLKIDLKFAMPGNAQAKIAERVFATLSRSLDDRPEFQMAHAGHKPGASPNAAVIPVPFEMVERVVAREVDRYNAETGRRSQGANGRSYQGVFDAGYAERTPRRMTQRQVYLSSLIYRPVAVDREGRVSVNGWTYGDPTTQEALLRYHGKGQRILLGRNPDDLSAPALAFDEDNRLICEDIMPIKRGSYLSVDGIRDAARYRKEARQMTAKAELANNYMADAEYKDALAMLDLIAPNTPLALPTKVIAAHFDGPLRKAKAANSEVIDEIPARFRANRDAAVAEKLAKSR